MPTPSLLPSAPQSFPARGASGRPPLKTAPENSAHDSASWEELCHGANQPSESLTEGLDESSFRHFAPLLHASQEYALHTGCRFRVGNDNGIDNLAAFDGIDNLAAALAEVAGCSIEGDPSIPPTGSQLAAKVHAMPTIKKFAERLKTGEPELLEEVDKAFRIIVAESARNMMIATVKGLGLFPPSPAPAGISEEDCCFEDASAPMPVIAQRLYNDYVRRERDECSHKRRLQRRSLTAAFLVDFAYEAGVTLPTIPETYQTLLQEFASRNSDFSSRKDAYAFSPDHDSVASERIISEDLVPAKADAGHSGWLARWHSALWTPAGGAIATEAPAGTAAVTEAQKAPQQRRTRPSGCI